MHIIHGTWIPDDSEDFFNGGQFWVWVESKDSFGLQADLLSKFFVETFPLPDTEQEGLKIQATRYFLLPSSNHGPLPSPELSHFLGTLPPTTHQWTQWPIDCISPNNPLSFLKEVHFLTQSASNEVRLGGDLEFWYDFCQGFKTIVLKDQYIPAMVAQKTDHKPMFFPSWQIVSPDFEKLVERFQPLMPGLCQVGRNQAEDSAQCYEPGSLLRQFSEQGLVHLIQGTNFTQKIHGALGKSFVSAALLPSSTPQPSPLKGPQQESIYRHWSSWKNQLTQSHQDSPFTICFRLKEAGEEAPDQWTLEFLAESRQDPSLKIGLQDYWYLEGTAKQEFQKYFGEDFEKQFLLQMGAAAQIYPRLWPGLETRRPQSVILSMDDASHFLQEQAWIMEEAGYSVIVPSSWTPEGQKRAKLRLKASAPEPAKADKEKKGYFSLYVLSQYEYNFSIGGEPVSKKEWEALIQVKTPLVRFRGEWMELDRDRMQEMLEFWTEQQGQDAPLNMADLVKKSVEEADTIEIELDDSLESVLKNLEQKSSFTLLNTPTGMQGELRPYQKRGLSWMTYLESLGMNPCLADDMGLGKTIQIIALLVQERLAGHVPGPTLLVAPTSVLGNWQKEVEKFAPHLKTTVHHGSQRLSDFKRFKTLCESMDVVITSFALVRLDASLLNRLPWKRIVIDEAQNIKNPHSAQTRAIMKLKAHHRIALTGTPVENRLLDLWSIFNFLNPGFLGNFNHFKKEYELPIQRENDPERMKELKKLVDPFILRRVKTDKSIIKDLPEKVEQKVYCNLSKEQASLYQAVVDEVDEALKDTEGIQRKGLILSTLMRLKQICNHPAQFLKDGSEFSGSRSQKLERLLEMVDEALDNGESLLIFTQFQEIGIGLEDLFHNQRNYRTWYLHGGTSRAKRETMIAEFQDPETEAGVFILSLKAGGVGITLTKANHVFHFDRWWNPAVENQATDRAFRIGQRKNVFVHKFVAVGTLEERVDRMLKDKQKLSDTIVSHDESWLTELDNETFHQLISLNRTTLME